MSFHARIERSTAAEPDLSGKEVFLHADRRIVAQGEALRLSTKGPGRITELANSWQQFLAETEIENKSGNPDIGLIALTSISFDEQSEADSILIIPNKTWLFENDAAYEITMGELKPDEQLNPISGEFTAGAQSDQKFLAVVEKAVERIEAGEIEKVVLAKDLILSTKGKLDLGKALSRLSKRYPDCWTYKIGNVFGASPELLLKADAGIVSARVLAGTAGRGTDPDVDKAIADGLAHSLKNKHEHLYAVQSLVIELRPFCQSVEFDEEPFSLALPDLWHLATDVRGDLKPQFNLLDVIAKLHPTAAVAGTPREKSLEVIRELEPFDRAGYAGPVGWLSSTGSGEIAIALRGGIIEESQIRAIAGCGIVSESLPQAELDETELKFKAVRWAFQSAS
jgi:menaquinone-specific isochorismate synthase